jgi:hypothetical protein
MFVFSLPLFSLLIDIIVKQINYNFFPTPAEILFKNSEKFSKMIVENKLKSKKNDSLNYNSQISKIVDISQENKARDLKEKLNFLEIELQDK